MSALQHWFTPFAKRTAALTGHPATFAAAISLILVWAISGPLFGFSDTWQLVINTGTTIITFLMVFVIQNTQNRDTEAIQIKLDELIHVTAKANNALLNLEELDADELARIKADYERVAESDRRKLRKGEEKSVRPAAKRDPVKRTPKRPRSSSGSSAAPKSA